MSEAKHTTGEWSAFQTKAKRWLVGARFVPPTPSIMFPVARIENGAPGDTLETEEANARLIAAAPEILAALRGLLLRFESKSFKGNVADIVSLNSASIYSYEKAWEDAQAAIAKAEGR